MNQLIKKIIRFKLSPPQVLVAGFFAIILIGALLLFLPFSVPPGQDIKFIDALFTATSAVCVTGLVVRDPSTEYSLFGQSVILILIQMGGLGYMTLASLFYLFIGKRVGLREELALQEALNTLTLEGLIPLAKAILKVTLAIEFVGAAILSIAFLDTHPHPRAVYLGLFHAVSAFNNAGFSLFSNNLMDYRGNLTVNFTISTLIIVGGIGFLVLSNLKRRYIDHDTRFLSLHTKFTLTITALLIMSATFLIFLLEYSNSQTLGSLPFFQKVLASYFQAVTPRTAGFNTVDIGKMFPVTLYLLILLMFVGASPGGTGGGIKTTTFGVIVAAIWTTLRGVGDVILFRRRLPEETIARAFSLAAMAFLFTAGVTFLLLLSERQGFLETLVEVISAFGTVGLSTGDGGIHSLSALFSGAGKFFIIFLMFVGRIGPLTVGAAVLKGYQHLKFRYAEATVLIG